METDPYKAQAGPELDAIIHARLMNPSASTKACPAYSTEDKPAKRVLSKLKIGQTTVIVGRTQLEGRTWFARYERRAAYGTEVFASTFALAVCRLALLRLEEAPFAR
ncbi:MAG: hypothetical protein AB9869_15605 [Verrucomicrobiia bacterium]